MAPAAPSTAPNLFNSLTNEAAFDQGGPASAVPLTRPVRPVRIPTAPGAWDPDVDPSVYEDETVAMTATELEAAADAKTSLPPAAPAPFPLRSQPPPKPWLVPPPPSSHPGQSSQSSNPRHFAAPPPTGPASNGGHAMLGSSEPPSSGAVFVPPPPFPSSPPPYLGAAQPFPQPLQPATRAESWALGRLPAPPNPMAEPFAPPPAPGRTWTSVEPSVAPKRENRWLFPLLLVSLGLGGLILGGLLGKTWIAHIINPRASDADSRAASVDPSLPPFAPLDANAVLEKAQADAVHCLKADTPPLTGVLVARFSPSGALDQLQMSGTLGNAPETPCVRSVFEKVRVAAFGGPPAQVEKALELRPQP